MTNFKKFWNIAEGGHITTASCQGH